MFTFRFSCLHCDFVFALTLSLSCAFSDLSLSCLHLATRRSRHLSLACMAPATRRSLVWHQRLVALKICTQRLVARMYGTSDSSLSCMSCMRFRYDCNSLIRTVVPGSGNPKLSCMRHLVHLAWLTCITAPPNRSAASCLSSYQTKWVQIQ